MPKAKRYIGITGFSNSAQVAATLEGHQWHSSYLVMIGVLASNKSLKGLPLDQPQRYPPREAYEEIFSSHEGVLNILHVNAPREALLETMLEARSHAGAHCHGIQVNKTWPEPEIFKQYKLEHPDESLILQCNNKAFSEASGTKQGFAERVAEYQGLADYVLIDQSGGTGIPFDISMARICLDALRSLSFSLGIAGGLSPASLHKLHGLKGCGTFSIDAESGLRSGDQDDEFVPRLARNYLHIADTIFRRHDANEEETDTVTD